MFTLNTVREVDGDREEVQASDNAKLENEIDHHNINTVPEVNGARANVQLSDSETQVTVGKRKVRAAVSNWRRTANRVETALLEPLDITAARHHTDLLKAFMESVSQAYDELMQLIPTNPDPEIEELYNSIEQDNYRLIKSTSQIVRQLNSDRDSRISSKGQKTYSVKSNRSSRASSRSSVTSVKAEAIAEAAMLKTKLKYLDRENEKKAELEKLQTMKELDMAEAKVKAISDLEHDDLQTVDQISSPDDHRTYVTEYLRKQRAMAAESLQNAQPENIPEPTSQHTEPERPSAVLPNQTFEWNPSAAEFTPSPPPPNETLRYPVSNYQQQNPISYANELSSLAKCFADQVNLSRIPQPEPSIFTGNALHYPQWKAAFNTLVEGKNIPHSERIYYLQKYLGGAAKEAVEGYFLINTADAYEQAKELLEHRYGDEFSVANAFRQKLDNWPKIAPRDGPALRNFADVLRQCEAAMATVHSLKVLHDCRENRKLLTKLPEWLTLRWARIVADWKENKKQFPPFSKFVNFINKEAEIACDPVTSLQAVKSATKPQSPERHQNRNVQRRIGAATALSTEVTSASKDCEKKCFLCNKNHHLDDCYKFLAKPLTDRKTFAKEKGLCFGCLSQGHLSKDCHCRRTCKTCKKRHPTSLHGDNYNVSYNDQVNLPKDIQTKSKEPPATSVSLLNDTGYSAKCSMILPVWISHCDRPGTEKLVYALLDTQSDTTFILDNTCAGLGLYGTPVKLRLSTMSAEDQLINSQKIDGLKVRGYNSATIIDLPRTYTREIMPANRSHIPTPEVARKWPHLRRIADQIPTLQDVEIGLLIGYNCSKALTPRDIIPPANDEPYGQLTDLGWGIVGIVDQQTLDSDPIGTSHRILACPVSSGQCESPRLNCEWSPKEVLLCARTSVKEIIKPQDITKMMAIDFSERPTDEKSLSMDDKKFLEIVKSGIRLTENNQYEMPLPFKNPDIKLPNNRAVAFQRLKQLLNRFKRDKQYKKDYTDFMTEIIQMKYAERVPETELTQSNGKVWYIPHHGIYHSKKPGKLRVVFDCSAKYQGQCVNDHLLQGPDLTNALVGVLCRFRLEPIAIMCDIEKMFFQFQVPENQRDFLRFLWCDDQDDEPVEYRMNVHLFGAKSSPGCANYGLKETATNNETECGLQAADFVRRNFYVDDGLTSVATVNEAAELIKDTKALCKKGGLRLHKFVSNSKQVLQTVPIEDQAKGVQELDLAHDSLPVERALGTQWCIQSDSFQFRIQLKDQPLTRRGILSTVCSIYDPLGFAAPVILVGKQILQEMCKDQLDWDSPLPDSLRSRWDKWRNSLFLLESVQIQRCVKPDDFGRIVKAELHHFSDASTSGYGQCSYLRLVNDSQEVHCSFMMGKARVAPIKTMTVPRLELTAAVVSVKVSALLARELEIPNLQEMFWTDSKVILGYIASDSKRFHVYVANRVQQIRDRTSPSQWNYVATNLNPADDGSRGLTAEDFIKDSKWITGPEFLWKPKLQIPETDNTEMMLDPSDAEVRTVLASNLDEAANTVVRPSILTRLERFSCWRSARRAIAGCLRIKSRLVSRLSASKPSGQTEPAITSLSVQELQSGESEIIRQLQQEYFNEEIKLLQATKPLSSDKTSRQSVSKQKRNLRRNSRLLRLDPFLDTEGILRVGGRLRLANCAPEMRHPAILPKDCHVTTLIIRHCHEKVAHQGRGLTINEIRSSGFWIVGASSSVSSYISKCVTCRRLRANAQQQRMADLPTDRLTPAPPFTYCGVDLFGPWYIKEKRSELKRYGVIFTCLGSRAIHIETANSLDTDSFLNAFRRFVSIRGPIRQLRCDRGTNFVGAETELRKAWEDMDHDRISKTLVEQNCDYFSFKMNVPAASHMGGIWERQIRSVRNVLGTLMHQAGSQLDDELLRTLMCEAAAIVNSRPLTVDNLNDPASMKPLSPNHLLTLKSDVLLPPPGIFQKTDLYVRKRWKRVQYLANEFWARWRKEYLQNITTRQKWFHPHRNVQIGDIVLVTDVDLPRNQWQLARVTETYPEDDDRVRKVRLSLGHRQLGKNGLPLRPSVSLDRPIHKLVLIWENNRTV